MTPEQIALGKEAQRLRMLAMKYAEDFNTAEATRLMEKAEFIMEQAMDMCNQVEETDEEENEEWTT